MCTLHSSWHTMAARHLMFWQPLSFVYCFSVCGLRGWTAFLKWSRGFSFFFNICYLWIHRKRLQQSLLLPTQHTLLWELGFSWTQVSFPLSSSPDLSLPIQDIVSAVWVFYTLSSCVTPPGMTAHLFVYTNVSSMLNGFVDLSSFGNGAVLLDQHPLSYCLKTHPSWRLP